MLKQVQHDSKMDCFTIARNDVICTTHHSRAYMPRTSKRVNVPIEPENKSTNPVCGAAKIAHAVTPAMQQYFAHKEKYHDCLLFYRMGDFYELFFDDAVKASAILDIALTKRGKHAGDDIPMCGVPVHAAEMYLQKLIASGHRIAICEQMETPEEAKRRGYKEIVRREVIRIVTPGTITEEALLSNNEPHYLAAFTFARDICALAWLELSTGEFCISEAPLVAAGALLARVNPKEILLSQTSYTSLADAPWFAEYKDRASIRADVQFDARKAEHALCQHYGVKELSSFGAFGVNELSAAGALFDYVKLTQFAAAARLDPPKKEVPDAAVHMDAATRRNLEITQTLTGERKGSLLHTLDRSVTAAGGRLLHAWLSAPSRELEVITARQDAVRWALDEMELRDALRIDLRSVADMERALGRLSLMRGGPRDVQLIGIGLTQATAIADRLRSKPVPARISEICEALFGHSPLAENLMNALMEDVPFRAADGNFVRSTYRDDLAEWRQLRDESKRILTVMESKLRKETDIGSLKIKHNNVLGYFVEITQIHEKKVPITFIHRQSLAGALRYTTTELNDTARKIEEAASKSLQLELLVFQELVEAILKNASPILKAARALAELDVLLALAERAEEGAWIRPSLTTNAQFDIRAGRHPVVEAALKRTHQEFIPNDCALMGMNNPQSLIPNPQSPSLYLITGPNMGGKSTFLRQQAMLAILAHIGSFVPAASATIGLVDKLFCRVGAADDLARGQSTFMVEMVETAGILHQATASSLVILDEIGRGTATYDGVSIAWAVAEFMHDKVQCRALFATHYHELTALAKTLPRLKNYHATAKEHQGQLIFLHTIREGFADKSYGIHVAALAGMPAAVLTRAKALLHTLESGHSITEQSVNALPLFAQATNGSSSRSSSTAISSSAVTSAPMSAAIPLTVLPTISATIPPTTHALAERLENIDPNTITPIEALQLLEELKKMAKT